jgi:type II secretory pathway component PulF
LVDARKQKRAVRNLLKSESNKKSTFTIMTTLLSSGSVIVLALLYLIVSNFKGVFSSLGTDLPVLTKAIILIHPFLLFMILTVSGLAVIAFYTKYKALHYITWGVSVTGIVMFPLGLLAMYLSIINIG